MSVITIERCYDCPFCESARGYWWCSAPGKGDNCNLGDMAKIDIIRPSDCPLPILIRKVDESAEWSDEEVDEAMFLYEAIRGVLDAEGVYRRGEKV